MYVLWKSKTPDTESLSRHVEINSDRETEVGTSISTLCWKLRQEKNIQAQCNVASINKPVPSLKATEALPKYRRTLCHLETN